jgi:hypothetical protein
VERYPAAETHLGDVVTLLALDLSTKTGAAFMAEADGVVSVVSRHSIELPKTIREYGGYPDCYLQASDWIAAQVAALVLSLQPKRIVIEETNTPSSKGSRYSQKILEFIHRAVLERLRLLGYLDKVYYVSSGIWRATINLKLSSSQRAANRVLSRAKSNAKAVGQTVDKKKLGIKGKVTWKHLSVAHANERFGLELKMVENDIADAICLGEAFLLGAETCDGT